MKKMRFVSLAMAGAMTLALLSGCSNDAPSPTKDPDPAATPGGDAPSAGVTLKIGGIGPTTGDAAIYGTATAWGAQVAVDEINAMGGDIKIDYKFEDDAADAEQGVNAYRSLQGWGMDVLYGCTTTGSCVAVAAETYNDRYFQLTPSASSPDVTAGKDNVFQMCFTDPNQGITAAKYIGENGLAKKVAVIYNNADPYSSGLATAFAGEAPNQGIEIVSTTTFSSDTNADFSVQINDAKSAGAEMIFLPIYYTPASNILKQAKDAGFTGTFFGCDGMDGILTMEGFDVSLAEGLMLITPFNGYATDDRTVNFVNAFKKLSNGVEPNQFAADGYDCVYAIYEAAKKAGITDDMTAEEICAAMVPVFTDPSFKIDGLTGSGMGWSANGEISKDPMVVVIKDGIYVNM